MRIAKTVQNERRNTVMGLLVTDPKMTLKAVNEVLKAKFGHAMHPKEIQKIRASAVEALANKPSDAVLVNMDLSSIPDIAPLDIDVPVAAPTQS